MTDVCVLLLFCDDFLFFCLHRSRCAHVSPQLKATFSLPVIGVKKNPSSPLFTQLGVITKGTIIEVNVSELGLVTTGGKVVWGASLFPIRCLMLHAAYPLEVALLECVGRALGMLLSFLLKRSMRTLLPGSACSRVCRQVCPGHQQPRERRPHQRRPACLSCCLSLATFMGRHPFLGRPSISVLSISQLCHGR